MNRIRARGIGDEVLETARTTMLAFGGLGLTWTLGSRWQLGFDVRGGPSVLRPTFVVATASENALTLHTPSAWRGAATLSVGISF